MQSISTARSSSKVINKIIVTYGTQSITFDGKMQIKLEKPTSNIEEEANLFDCFNDYVSSVISDDDQKKLFEQYRQAKKIITKGTFNDYRQELAQLKPIVDQILEYVNIEKYCSFIHYSKYIKIPKELAISAAKGDYPVETTILDDDYVEMVKLSFVARTVFPIIFELLDLFSGIMGDNYKEYVCGKLLKNNETVRQLPGYHKLVGVIVGNFNKTGIPSQTTSVTNNEHFIERVVYKTIFIRLCCAVIPESQPDKNLATSIAAEIKQNEGEPNKYRAKENGYEEEEDNRSVYDRYQLSEEVNSTKEEMQAEFFAFGLYDEQDNPKFVDRFKYQCMSLGIKQPELVEIVYDNLPTVWDFDLEHHILRLLELVYMGKLSSPVFSACNYEQLMCAIALGQVMLSEQGYHYLPSVLCAIVDPNGMRSNNEGFKLNSEDREAIEQICDIQIKNVEDRSANAGIQAAVAYLDKYSNGCWMSNLEFGVLENKDIYSRVKQGSMFPIEMHVGIKNEYIKLVLEKNK